MTGLSIQYSTQGPYYERRYSLPRKKKGDAAKLITASESGRPAKEIMAKFGLKTAIQLKSYYLDALMEKGKAAGISGIYRFNTATSWCPDFLIGVYLVT
jgi:hypothetical protein